MRPDSIDSALKKKCPGGLRINIINHQKKIALTPALIAGIKRAVRETILRGEKKSNEGRVNIRLCDDKEIRGFNKKYFKEDCPTDVISFGAVKLNLPADIIISTDTAISNSRIYKTTPIYELLLYVIHGRLHFLGYSDTTKKGKLIMDRKQGSILRKICPLYRRPKQ